MKKWIYFLAILFFASCKKDNVTIYFTPEKATKYFREIKAICDNDNGKLLGKNLFGPLMLIDRPTRKIFANQPDKEGILKEKDGIFSGVYPKELIINNIPVEFGGTLFAMAPLPAKEDDFEIKIRAVHSLVHCFQRLNKLESRGFNTRHMDDKNARLWLKLEWRALRNAISREGELRLQAIRDALIFRGARRELYPMAANDENRFELYEGLATFTYLTLCSDSVDESKRRLLENLDKYYKYQSYGRIYGFIHGALYAYLAYEKGFDFKTIQKDTVDLSHKVRNLYDIQLPAICRDVAGSLALNYDMESIYKEEEQRLADIRERIHKEISIFTEKPVVFLELESPYFDFEPEDIRSLDTLGTIYRTIRVSDNWGKLTVDEGGCLVSYNIKFLRITARNFQESKNHITGDGWHIVLNNDWQVAKVDQNYFIRKLMP
ncbi:MAG: hypothetical protein C0408_03155 [Odoribacter sp.]|nr:hypothetical protein [Odoribacter sp.]